MPRSVTLDPRRKPQVLTAMARHGFLSQGALAGHVNLGLSTVNNFINSRPVYLSSFEILCDALGLDILDLIVREPREGVEPQSPLTFYSYDGAWVGREQTIERLREVFPVEKRLLLILGLTGIGKTALAERLMVDCYGDFERWERVNLEGLAVTSFGAIALPWLQRWGVVLSPADHQPEQLIRHLLNYLEKHRVLLLLDSLEVLLTVDQEGGVFVDQHWAKFFQAFLALSPGASRIIVTSQELPELLVQQRYGAVWESLVLGGLTAEEQRDLWVATGLDYAVEAAEFGVLARLGAVYRGHPLVLRVMVGEIWESFGGNVLAYWREVEGKIEEVEVALAAAERDAGEVMGAGDQWRLHKLTRKVRLEVNRQRLAAVFERLARQVPDAYWLLCAAAVYRVPVQVEGWLIQLVNWVRAVEGGDCAEERQERALGELVERFLLEESVDGGNRRLLGQHPLIRSLALEHYQRLVGELGD